MKSTLPAPQSLRSVFHALCLLALITQMLAPALASAAGTLTPAFSRLAASAALSLQSVEVAGTNTTIVATGEPAFVNVVVEPETLPADGATSAQVLVYVSDADGLPVADGTPVYLSGTLGSLETAALVTRDGLAQTTLVAPEKAGSGAVVAQCGAVQANATFRAQPGQRAGQTADALPPDALAAAIERARNPLRPQTRGQWAAANRRYTAIVSAQGVQMTLLNSAGDAVGWNLSLQLDSVYVGDREIYHAKDLAPQVRDNAALFQHTPALSEQHIARDVGMQQLFTLAAPPDLPGDLVLAVSLSTPLRAELLSAQQGVLFFSPNTNPNKDERHALLTYSGALARDAGGRTLYADLTLDKNTLFLRLPEAWLAQAGYPVVIDPLIGSPALISDPRPQQDELALAYNPGDDEYLAVWEHFTTGGPGSDLRAQRFQADGTLLGNPISVTTASGDQLQPAIAFNPATDEYLVVWSDYRQDVDGDVYAQRITAGGVLTGSAIAVAAASGLEAEPSVAANPDDNLYLVVWGDRPGNAIYVSGQIIAASGVLSGAEIAIYDETGDNQQPRAAYNAADGEFLVVWSRWWQDIYGQRLSGQGVPLDNAGTPADESQSDVAFTVSAAAGHQYSPEVVADPLSGNYLVVWQDNRNESYGDLYGQLVAGNGALSGSEIALSVVSGSLQAEATLTYDAVHQNYLAVWSDMRLANNEDLYAQAITAGGVLSGSAFSVYSATLSQIHPAVVSRPADGASLVVWNEFGTASHNLYARRLDSAGALPGTAFPLQVPGDFKQYPAVAYHADGESYLVVWEDLRHGLNSVYARAYTAQGAPQGENFALSAAPGSSLQLHPRVAAGPGADAGIGYLAVWEDQSQDPDGDIYAQRFTAQGVLTGSVFTLAATDERQTAPALAYNAAAETYLAVWRDMRVDSAGDIYGQILDATGTISGSAFVVSAYSGYSQFAPEVSVNPASGVFLVVWHQYTGSGNYDVYAQMVNGNGVLLDHPGSAADESAANVSLALTTNSAYQTLPQVAVDPDSGAALVVWDDQRSGNSDVYGQRLDASGALTGSNFVIAAADYLQRVPAVTVITGTGEFLVTWNDTRSGAGRGALYGQRVAADGSLHGDNEWLGENGNWTLGLALAPAPTLGRALVAWEWGYEIYLQFYSVVAAAFSATPLAGYAPLPVAFSNASAPAGELTAFDWDFGDGGTSAAISPTHLYAQPGVYSVTLSVSGPDGAHSLTRVAYIAVTATPTQEVGLQGHWPLDEVSGTRYDASPNGNDLTDNNTVGYASGVISRAADLERDATESLSIAHSLQQGLAITGSLTLAGWIRPESVNNSATLVSKYAYGTANERSYRLDLLGGGYLRFMVSPDGTYSESRDAVYGPTYFTAGTWGHVAAVFDAAESRLTLYCDGVACGARTIGYSALYAGTAPFVLGATTYNGAAWYPYDGLLDDWRVYDRALSAAEIQALREPVAIFSAAPVTGSAPLSVTFSNFSQGTVSAYLWTFGDGVTSTLENPTHVYTAPGDYDVSLTVNGPAGGDDLVINDYIHVSEGGPDDQPPQATAGSDQNAAEGDLLSFSGVITDSDTPTGHTILWDFGDGTTVSGVLTPTHAYGDNGVFTVTLTVTDTTGLSAADHLTVNAANVAPTVTLGITPTTGNTDTLFAMSGAFDDPGTQDTHTILWDFGDGITAAGQLTQTHTYANAGHYTATLQVTDDDGGAGQATAVVTVTAVVPTPVAGFDAAPLSGDVPLTVIFTNTSTAADAYLWDFGDGLTDTVAHPTHIYYIPGVYTLTLTASGPGGSDVLTRSAAISVTAVPPEPVANFTATPVNGYASLTVTFSNLSSNADAYTWDFGDGSAPLTTGGAESDIFNPTHVYTAPGVYTVTLTASGPGGADTLARPAYIAALSLNAAPQITLTTPGEDTVVGAGAVEIGGVIWDDELATLGGVWVNEVTATVANGAFTATVPVSAGNQTLYAVVVDAENEYGVDTAVLRVDGSGPLVTIHTPRDRQAIYTLTPTVGISYTDFYTAVNPASFAASLQDAHGVVTDVTAAFSAGADGATGSLSGLAADMGYTLTVSISDALGNPGSQVSRFYVPQDADSLTPPAMEDGAGWVSGYVYDSEACGDYLTTCDGLAGARVTLQDIDHATRETTNTITGALITGPEGFYAFPVNVTGAYAVRFEKDGYTYSQREVAVVRSRSTAVNAVYLTRLDTATTYLSYPITQTVVHTSSNGKLRLEIPAGALAPGQAVTVTATNFEHVEFLPSGELPPGTGETYAFNLGGDSEVQFTRPITVMIQNTREFTPGTKIPLGYWDQNTLQWEHVGVGVVDAGGEWGVMHVEHFSNFDWNAPFVPPDIDGGPDPDDGDDCPCPDGEEGCFISIKSGQVRE